MLRKGSLSISGEALFSAPLSTVWGKKALYCEKREIRISSLVGMFPKSFCPDVPAIQKKKISDGVTDILRLPENAL